MTAPIQIPAVSFWAAAGGLIVAAGTSLVGLIRGQIQIQRRLDTKLSYAEHNVICRERDQKTGEALTEIKGMLRQQEETLATLKTDVAVVKERLKHVAPEES